MARNEAPEEVRVDASREIVSRGDGAEGARVVVEPRRVVDARRLRRELTVARHPLDGIVEPPGRAEAYGRIVTGERRQLTRVCRLVQREQHEGEARIVPVRVEQRVKVSRVLGRDGNVGSFVGTKAGE